MFLTEEEYNHTLRLWRNQEYKRPILVELASWFESTFEMPIYNYLCDTTINGLTRLRLVLWNHEYERKMSDGVNLDADKQKKIAKQFAELCNKYNQYPAYHKAENIFVCYETLEDELEKRILRSVASEIKAVSRQDIWKIEIMLESIHVFFETDEQASRHLVDGVCDSINNEMTGILAKYDPFSIYQKGIQCVFTSHQTLDEKYQGSMFYYIR